MKHTFKELESNVIQWAIDKGIIEKATPLRQWEKTQEELNELHEALLAKNNNMRQFFNSKNVLCDTEDEIQDSIGDTLVTLIIQAQMNGYEIEECLNKAYNVIKNRTGKMINGQFVKDEL